MNYYVAHANLGLDEAGYFSQSVGLVKRGHLLPRASTLGRVPRVGLLLLS